MTTTAGSTTTAIPGVADTGTTAVWAEGATPVGSDDFPHEQLVDIVVVGAGIAGLTAAALFARAGQRVVVLESRYVGAVTTGRSTAKVSQLQGTQLSHVRSRGTAGMTRAYAASQKAAFDWLVDFSADRDVALERRDAYTYASAPEGRADVEREFELARAMGLPVTLLDHLAGDAALPYATHGAVRLPDQAQLDPRRLLAALALEVRMHGGRIVEGARVTGVHVSPLRADARLRVSLGDEQQAGMRAGRVVLATGSPILDRGLYFGKLSATRSYAQAWRVPGEQLPDGMYLGTGTPTRSVRTIPRGADDNAGERLLLVGGNGHGVGRHTSPRAASDDLGDWTERWWPGAELVTAWSAQDYSTPHGVPFVGWLPRGGGRVYLATGFSKWGMTNGVATGLTLAADILGEGATDWQRALHRRLTVPAAIAAGIGENAAVGAWYARSWARALRAPAPAPDELADGQGRVGRQGLVPTGVSVVDGESRSVCAVCPHLGAVVQWNDLERSWDCPAHGSRFTPDGAVLEGPTKRGLAPR